MRRLQSRGILIIVASGGFATVNPDSSMQIAGMEVVTLDQIDPAVRKH